MLCTVKPAVLAVRISMGPTCCSVTPAPPSSGGGAMGPSPLPQPASTTASARSDTSQCVLVILTILHIVRVIGAQSSTVMLPSASSVTRAVPSGATLRPSASKTALKWPSTISRSPSTRRVTPAPGDPTADG